ncbi:hypothetical protein SAMN05216553_102642 [Lentzea fradiae]|uniref:Uncharacterized protein n=1 Tax=Lentzea fradiae TaxID=200378 RepID=A0A1G7N4J2_9PSEU|nr:hypothetical protein SAMN05216553_102642 [Lentzea fradiae]
MDHVLAGLLRERVFAILASLESPETHRLTTAWRALLHLHEQTESGTCRACGRRRGHMCSVWRVAATHFLSRE